jgi:peptidoglycan/LPS O-acetylase OafA/YrhL
LQVKSPGLQRSGVEYGALEGWRGICAVLVALFHFQSVLNVRVNSHVLSSPVIDHAYLFVDFFFVLSGFVIASRYQDRISSGATSVADFLKLRLGRLYPLHLFTLLLMMVIYTYVGREPDALIGLRAAPIDTHVWSFLANVFLLQGLHTTATATWNHPSWSVSTEFATYVVYALLWKTQKKRTTWLATLLIIVAAPVAIARIVGHIDTTFDWGILRSLFGFALGATVFNALRRPAAEAIAARVRRGAASAIELAVIVLIIAFVAQPDHTVLTIAAPFVFALAVLIFSRGAGMVSALLGSRLFRHAGTISYSVYLLHQPLQELFMVGALWCYATFGWSWMLAGDPAKAGPLFLGASPLLGDAITAAMLLMLLAASTLTWRVIETPCRAWVRDRVQRAQASRRARPGSP